MTPRPTTSTINQQNWNLSPKEAVRLQSEMASRVSFTPPKGEIGTVCGCDIALSRDGTRCIAGAVVWDIRERRVLETQTAVERLTFPYVPGLLSFREAPALLVAIAKLKSHPDVFMFDGQGYAHPRRFGLACHIGVVLNRPSIGCAKSRLIGAHSEPALRRGSRRALRDKRELVGAVLRTRDNVKPVYVSIGHQMDLATAIKITLRCGSKYRVPEPTRLADRLVAATKLTL